ncbi:MAG TPA: hypothetical protein EYN00_08480 [Planctomycetes bacterium]|nr:hypothetical protein [Planctomycetota bacterium]
MADPSNLAVKPKQRGKLTLFTWLLVGYLLTWGGLSTYRGVVIWAELGGVDREALWGLLVGTFALLLGLQLMFRVPGARFSIAILFLMQIFATVQRFAILDPQLWWTISITARLQVLLESGFLLIALVWMFRSATLRAAR